MIADISKKIYEVLSQDTTLQALLPSNLDNSNIVEMRSPKPADGGTFPVVVYRVRFGTQNINVKSLDVMEWLVEIEVLDNNASMSAAWTIYERIYALLHNRNLTSGNGIAYQCEQEYLDTAYDSTTAVNFILTRFKIISREKTSTTIGDLS